ncbi:MAG: hypothetical protein AB7U85_06065 [Alphaproteobacteria bacterium]
MTNTIANSYALSSIINNTDINKDSLIKEVENSSLKKLDVDNKSSLINLSELDDDHLKLRFLSKQLEEMPKFMEEQKKLMEEQLEVFQEFSSIIEEMSQIKKELMDYEVAQKIYPSIQSEYERLKSTEPEAAVVLTGDDAKAALRLGRKLNAMPGYTFTDMSTLITYSPQDDGTVLAHKMGVPVSDAEKRSQLSYLKENIAHWKPKASVSADEISSKKARYDELQTRKEALDNARNDFAERQKDLSERRANIMSGSLISFEA